ncbi:MULTISPECIES: helix-turn-helix domain-containing protein [Aminobacter]|uniref:AraC-like DNA-binding protein n=2 Tax=Aminobacter TaxID=31988 RepID=A0ABR6H4W4_AMIAI|nr:MULTISPECIES: helix-turn-helix domain-containing protein [Aminobacter]MBA8907817.1 AraC-like DNA-binding protein [Aminobacter ciceronei]MBA9021589.1 AraC-like DNA-binding protein [Aminobacter ciceronei]MBB3705537.1 AraC-like DNA-binding protein [Aminobacter aminovorans]MRX33917.1 helix-turn-helix domain-containing protein [Aminobacter sp. MDW-2]QNH34049.1 AraC family transcriptional regulator [Aminobacter sp. MDW-2]
MNRSTVPVLANCLGHYDEQAPMPDLDAHFQCVWTNAIPDDHVGPVAVVPDGCVDLLWKDGRLMVVGPDIVAASPELHGGTTVLGIRFRPGAALRWLRTPMSAIVGQAVDLADVWNPGVARELCLRIGEAPTIERQAAVLQQQLLKQLPDLERPAQGAGAIFAAMASGSDEIGGRISLLVERLDISERTLRRRSHDYFGYGPKTLDRILRFQNFLSLVRAQGKQAMAGLAYEAGYADQAHLGREIQALCGMTAGSFVRQITG